MTDCLYRTPQTSQRYNRREREREKLRKIEAKNRGKIEETNRGKTEETKGAMEPRVASNSQGNLKIMAGWSLEVHLDTPFCR